MSEGSEIQGRRRTLLHRDDGPEELSTRAELSAEEDDPEVLTTTTEASIEEEEDTTRLSEHLRQWRRRCVYGLIVLTMKTAALEEQDGPADSRGQGIYDVSKGSETTTEAAGARRRARWIYNGNGCVDGGI